MSEAETMKSEISDILEKLYYLLKNLKMNVFTAYVEWCSETNLYVGIVPGIPGAHT